MGECRSGGTCGAPPSVRGQPSHEHEEGDKLGRERDAAACVRLDRGDDGAADAERRGQDPEEGHDGQPETQREAPGGVGRAREPMTVAASTAAAPPSQQTTAIVSVGEVRSRVAPRMTVTANVPRPSTTSRRAIRRWAAPRPTAMTVPRVSARPMAGSRSKLTGSSRNS